MKRDLSYLICHLSASLFPCTTRDREMHDRRFVVPPAWGSPPIYSILASIPSFSFPASSISPSYTRSFPSSIKILRKKLKTSKNLTSFSNDFTVSCSLYSKFLKVLPGLSFSPILPSHSILQLLPLDSQLISPPRNIWHSYDICLESFCSLARLYITLAF